MRIAQELRIHVQITRRRDHFGDQNTGEQIRIEIVSEPQRLATGEGSPELENPVVSESTGRAASDTESGFSGVDMHGLRAF